MIKLKNILTENEKYTVSKLLDAAQSKKIYGKYLDSNESQTSVSIGSPMGLLVWNGEMVRGLLPDDSLNWKVLLDIAFTDANKNGKISIKVQGSAEHEATLRNLERKFRQSTNAITKFRWDGNAAGPMKDEYEYYLSTTGTFKNDDESVGTIFYNMLLMALKSLAG